MMALLSRAAGSAVRIAGSKDPAAGFANDFLGGLLGDAAKPADPSAQPAKPTAAGSDPLGSSLPTTSRLGPIGRPTTIRY
ncbi:hypothetical protein [Ottowia testudinis]|uniref:Uncharacterized protein n=1 Tax=Ottowia testudinis TaxID=2816950 RepID=A0A975H647_9BURK|nr:hypothetical protein [Ottowia testudinis]QTD45632.1 hypothetical protein J1M35_01525 [Ottowia testudinis]QTD46036.1 hypothetical protein J1M35_03755 [Ottowia testudinis]